MSNMNFFSWIRDGVRQSVLMGVSDAAEQLGTPPTSEDLHPSVAGFFEAQRTSPKLTSKETTAPKTNRGRKRLGKSLKDIGPTTAK